MAYTVGRRGRSCDSGPGSGVVAGAGRRDRRIDILRDEQGHLRLFEGFLREYEAAGLS
jgi:hypothetical protein